jgi:hypothetical protein
MLLLLNKSYFKVLHYFCRSANKINYSLILSREFAPILQSENKLKFHHFMKLKS